MPIPVSQVQRRVVLFGGGLRSRAGMSQFLQWVRERAPQPRILLIAWSSEEPHLAHQSFQEDLLAFGDVKIEFSPHPPKGPKETSAWLALAGQCDGIFFSGGDQVRVETTLRTNPRLLGLKTLYRAGVPFAGTSAGTAIMSELMIAGDVDPDLSGRPKAGVMPILGKGLGLLENAVTDQHFLKRGRQARLFQTILKHPHLIGIGVDEDGALCVRDERHCEVVSPEKVMFVEGSGCSSSLNVSVLSQGHRYDLHRRAHCGAAATVTVTQL